ncbi:hypothetical protein M3Y94_01075200 [Aphelenchoides besseyi]|nr:hypothetical protein M3Y94_01075200 [Aphelenchoides besseyi]KAI6218740.1 hypothetical protein M3Y95_01148100 [Aphelenchoides besseyi]
MNNTTVKNFQGFDPNYPRYMIGVVVLQTLFILIGIKCFFLFLAVFHKRAIFHRNLNITMYNWLLSWLVTMVCRLIICCGALIDWRLVATPTYRVVSQPLVYIEIAKVISMYATVFIMGLVLLERVLATICLQIYETTDHVRSIVVLNIFGWIYGCLGCWYAFEKANLMSWSSLTLIAISLFIGISYGYAYHTNKRRLRESKRSTEAIYSLSERFQLNENLRMLRIITSCVWVFLVMIAFNVLTWIVVILFIPDEFMSKFYVLRGVRELVGTLTSNAMLYSIVTGTHAWKTGIWTLLKQFGGTILLSQNVQTKVAPRLTSADRLPIEFDAKLRSALYFSQLNKAWN